MRKVLAPLLWVVRALSWPVAAALTVGYLALSLSQRWVPEPLCLIAFLTGFLLVAFLVPLLALWRLLWGIVCLFRRRFREGLEVLLVGVPLTAAAWWLWHFLLAASDLGWWGTPFG